MPIPEAQLETWSHQGAVTTSARTYASVADALSVYHGWPNNINYEPFLQGSYANHTNVRADSDVDIVVCLGTTFQPDISTLNGTEQALFSASYSNATYRWADFKAHVLQALRARHNVTDANKCVEVAARPGLLAAHVVPSIELRIYHSFANTVGNTFTEGIQFWTRDGTPIRNFPKQHIQIGADKNRHTTEWYKPTIRMFKNARSHLVEAGTIPGGLAPSYFLECLLYNVPDGNFGQSFQQTFYSVLNYLYQADPTPFHCQNEQQFLFGTLPWQWSVDSARSCINALTNLWNNWA